MRCFLFDLDGTIFGDLSSLANSENDSAAAARYNLRDSNDTRKDAWKGFVDGALELHRHLEQTKIPFAYLSDTGVKDFEGVDAKFKSLGITEGAGGARRVWTSALGLGAFFANGSSAFENAHVFMVESGDVFEGKIYSCLRTIRGYPGVKIDSWVIRMSLDDRQAAEWAAMAAAGKPVIVLFCAENPGYFMDSTVDNGNRDFDFHTLKHVSWLISNGATLIAHALDDFLYSLDPLDRDLPYLVPGPGTILRYLTQAKSLPDRRDTSLVIGKGGNLGSDFMFKFGMELLRQQQASHASAELPVLPSNCAMVGDTLNTDIIGGQSFGMKTIWFTQTGIHRLGHFPAFAAEGVRPTCRLANARALLSLLQRKRGDEGQLKNIPLSM